MNKAWLNRRLALGIFASMLLAGCASTPPAPVSVIQPTGAAQAGAPAKARPGYYIVRKGDTLYSIALEHGVSYQQLAAWNSLSDPNKIAVGQQLRVVPPKSATQVAVSSPISAPAPVEGQPLTTAPANAAAPPANTATLKRGPKGGKEPYSPQALAKMKQAEASSSPAASAPQAPSAAAPSPAAASPGQPAASTPKVQPPASTVAAPASQHYVDADGMSWVWPLNGKLIHRFGENGNKGIDIAATPGEPVLAAAAGKVVYVGSSLRGYGKLVIIKHNATFLSAYAHNSKILVKEGQMVTSGQEIAEAGSTDADQPMLHFEIRRYGKPVNPLKHLPPRSP